MFQIEVKGLDRLVKRLENYANDLESKKKTFLEKLGEIGVTAAKFRFADAEYAGFNDVAVEPTWIDDNTLAVMAVGSSVLFIEFGTGIRYEEHPMADEFGYHHGTYGQGKGANPKGWVYKGVQGNAGIPVTDRSGRVKDGVYRTFGNPPARAMYEASKDMRNKLLDIAKEVFTP